MPLAHQCSDLRDMLTICVNSFSGKDFIRCTDVLHFSDNSVNDKWWHSLLVWCSDVEDESFNSCTLQTGGHSPRALGVTAWGAYLIQWLSQFKANTPKAEVGTGLMMSACSLCYRGLIYQPSWIKDSCRCQHWTDGSLSDGMVVQHKGVMPVLKDFLRNWFVTIII